MLGPPDPQHPPASSSSWHEFILSAAWEESRVSPWGAETALSQERIVVEDSFPGPGGSPAHDFRPGSSDWWNSPDQHTNPLGFPRRFETTEVSYNESIKWSSY